MQVTGSDSVHHKPIIYKQHLGNETRAIQKQCVPPVPHTYSKHPTRHPLPHIHSLNEGIVESGRGEQTGTFNAPCAVISHIHINFLHQGILKHFEQVEALLPSAIECIWSQWVICGRGKYIQLSHQYPGLILFRMKLESCKGMDQMPAEFIQAEGKTLRSDIHKLVISACNKDLPQQGNKSVTVLIQKKRLNLQ